MRKIWTVARREFLSTVKTKAFIVGVLAMPVFMCVGTLVMYITEKMEDQGEKTYAIIDRTEGRQFAPIFESAVKRRNLKTGPDPKSGKRSAPIFKLEIVEKPPESTTELNELRLKLSDRIRAKEITGVLEIGPDVIADARRKASELSWKMTSNRIRKQVPFGGKITDSLENSSLIGRLFGTTERTKPQPDATPGNGHVDSAPAPVKSNDRTTIRYQCQPTANGAMEFYRFSLTETALAMSPGMADLDETLRDEVMNARPPVEMYGLTTRDLSTGGVTEDVGSSKALANLGIGIASVLLIFTMVLMTATPLLQNALEEKMNKTAEVLLASVSPFQLMAGKLLGAVIVALLLAFLYVGGAYWAVHRLGYGSMIGPSLAAWFLFYLFLAIIMYGSLFTAIGAACNDMKEPQSLMMPLMLPLTLPMMLLGVMIRDPDGLFTRVVSFIPTSAPMIMLLRQAMDSNVLWWEPFVAGVGVLLFTLFCVWVGGRIFRIGILSSGKAPTLAQLCRWAVNG